MPNFKSVQFAYANSDIADDAEMPNGCWYVATMDDQFTTTPDIEYTNESKQECILYAESMFYNAAWSTWSMHDMGD